MRIAVLGAGVAGLVAGMRLTEAGHTVDVYERWPGLGGQAATLDVGQGHLLERYYHHLFSTDRHIAALYEELGMADELEWITSSVAYFTRRQAVAVRDPARPAALQAAAAAVADPARRRRAGDPARTGQPGAVRARHRARLDRALHGQARVARAVGPAAAREVRRARRRHRDGVAAEQVPAAARRRRRRGEARLPEALMGAAVRRAARPDRGRRRARADRPPGREARPRASSSRRARRTRSGAATTRATSRRSSPSATTPCSRPSRATSSSRCSSPACCPRPTWPACARSSTSPRSAC